MKCGWCGKQLVVLNAKTCDDQDGEPCDMELEEHQRSAFEEQRWNDERRAEEERWYNEMT